MTYNGYPNWETWNVELWVDNEEPLYREKQRFIRRNCDEGELDSENVESFCRELFPDGTPDFKDNPKRCMCAVDWEYLAELWTEEAAEYRVD